MRITKDKINLVSFSTSEKFPKEVLKRKIDFLKDIPLEANFPSIHDSLNIEIQDNKTFIYPRNGFVNSYGFKKQEKRDYDFDFYCNSFKIFDQKNKEEYIFFLSKNILNL